MPHQVGYIDLGDSQNFGELPDPNDMGAASAERQPSPLAPEPSAGELEEIKTIMRGEKEFSKDREKRARQKELIKSMTSKSSENNRDNKANQPLPELVAPKSSAEPSPKELVEAKAIMKGQQELSTQKDKRAPQKEMIKTLSAKRYQTDGTQPKPNPPISASSASEILVEPPTEEELVELQAILQGKSKLSEDKGKRSRQKALIKMITSGGEKGPVPTRKEVRFTDTGDAGALPGTSASGYRVRSSGQNRAGSSILIPKSSGSESNDLRDTTKE